MGQRLKQFTRFLHCFACRRFSTQQLLIQLILKVFQRAVLRRKVLSMVKKRPFCKFSSLLLTPVYEKHKKQIRYLTGTVRDFTKKIYFPSSKCLNITNSSMTDFTCTLEGTRLRNRGRGFRNLPLQKLHFQSFEISFSNFIFKVFNFDTKKILYCY